MTEPRLKTVRCLHPGGLHRMAYAEWGDEDNPSVVVCVHGLTRNGRDFDTLARALAPRHRVVCPDIVGRGRSDRLADWRGYGFAQYVGDCVTLIARLDVERLAWVGTSMGGLIGMMIAAADDSPIARFVINDVGPVIGRAGLLRIGAAVGGQMRFASVDAALAHLATVSATFGPHTPEQWRTLNAHMVVAEGDGFVLAYDPRIGDAAREEIVRPAAGDLWPFWDRIRCPTLIVRGADSDLLEAEVAEAMGRRGPSAPPARCIAYAGVGHAPTLTRPEQVADVVAFLDAAPSHPPMRPSGRAFQQGARPMSIQRVKPGKRMSEAVIHNGTVYLAGQVATAPKGADAAEQTRQVLAEIDRILVAAGTDKAKLLAATIYLTDIGNFAAMNAVWDAWVSPGNPPARATVEAKLASPEYLVEIVVSAAV